MPSRAWPTAQTTASSPITNNSEGLPIARAAGDNAPATLEQTRFYTGSRFVASPAETDRAEYNAPPEEGEASSVTGPSEGCLIRNSEKRSAGFARSSGCHS
jgi:hypothetical protein